MTNSPQSPLPRINNRFELVRFLGEGTIGKTYLADDKLRNQQIAIKIVHEDIISDAGGFQNLRAKLNQIASLSHPQVGRLYDFGFSAGNVYLVMELMIEPSLQDILTKQSKETEEIEAFDLIHQAASIILALEDQLPHGSLQPNNIWIDKKKNVRLSDYGLAGIASSRKQTSAATLLGKAPFLPPETFASNAPPSLARDAFSLGILWMELLQKPSETKQQAPNTRIRTLTQNLTSSTPKERIQALRQLVSQSADRKHRKPYTLLKAFAIPIACLVLLLGLLALRPPWPTLPIATDSQASLSQASISQYFSRAKLISQRTTKLLLTASKISELSNAIATQLTNEQIIDALWEANLSQLEEENSQERLSSLEQKQIVNLQRVEDALAALENLMTIASRLAEIEDALSHVTVPSPHEGSDAAEAKNDLLNQIKGGQFRSAAIGSRELATELELFRKRILDTAFNQAHQAREKWQNALSAVSMDYIEPYSRPSQDIHDLGLAPQTTNLKDTLERLASTTHLYHQWTRSLGKVPTKKPESLENSIGMRFRQCGSLWASIWETRAIDFAYFVQESGSDMRRLWRERAKTKDPLHPVVNISRNDADDFCRWLTQRDQARGILLANERYRLPRDLEWSTLAGLPEPDDGRRPSERGWEYPEHYPWGTLRTPKATRGNYFTPFGASEPNNYHGHDPYLETAPVGQFPPNQYGFYDLGGNVWEWVSDDMNIPSPDSSRRSGYARGGGWRSVGLDEMKTEARRTLSHDHEEIGFRIVLEKTRPAREILEP